LEDAVATSNSAGAAGAIRFEILPTIATEHGGLLIR